MKDGFIRVAAATPDIHVADPQYNSEQIIELMEQGIIIHAFVVQRYKIHWLFYRSCCIIKNTLFYT